MRRLSSRPVLLAALAITLLLPPSRAPGAGGGLAVVVHPARADALGVDELARIFLKQRKWWADGQPIVAVNREAQSDARLLFSRKILGRTPEQLVDYWNRQYFQGVLPPATLASSEAVKRFVAAEKNAVGYVDAESVDGSVRVVLRIEP